MTDALPPLELGSFMAGMAAGIALMAVIFWATDHLAAKRAAHQMDRRADATRPARRRNRDTITRETTDMIQRELKPSAGTGSCDCGRKPRLIETRGNPRSEQLATTRATHYHLECPPCGLTTDRYPSAVVAEAKWNAGLVHPISVTRLSA